MELDRAIALSSIPDSMNAPHPARLIRDDLPLLTPPGERRVRPPPPSTPKPCPITPTKTKPRMSARIRFPQSMSPRQDPSSSSAHPSEAPGTGTDSPKTTVVYPRYQRCGDTWRIQPMAIQSYRDNEAIDEDTDYGSSADRARPNPPTANEERERRAPIYRHNGKLRFANHAVRSDSWWG